MRHFLVYHNEVTEGGAMDAGFNSYSSKNMNLDLSDRIWVIVGIGKSPQKEFVLWKTFTYEQIIKNIDEVKKHRYTYVGSKGKTFKPPISLNEYSWFADKKFKLQLRGMTHLVKEKYISALLNFL